MKIIYKYPIPALLAITYEMPEDAKLLHVADQHGVPTMWFEVDKDKLSESREFVVIGTGHEIHEEPWYVLNHIGSTMSGVFVWHIYEKVMDT